MVNSVDLPRSDHPWNNHLKTFRTMLTNELVSSFSGCHLLVIAKIMPHPDRLRFGNAEVEPCDREVTALFQFSKPLVRNVEVAVGGHGKNAFRVVALLPKTCNAVAKNVIHVLLRREVDEDHHATLDVKRAPERL